MTELETKLAEIVKVKGEDDGICHIIYFDETFNNVLNAECKDLIAAYCDNENGGLCFLVSSEDDSIQGFIKLSDFDFDMQLEIVDYIKNF